MVPARLANMLLIVEPSSVIAARQTTAMRAGSRPYSASVAPSSLRVRNLLAMRISLVMNFPPPRSRDERNTKRLNTWDEQRAGIAHEAAAPLWIAKTGAWPG